MFGHSFLRFSFKLEISVQIRKVSFDAYVLFCLLNSKMNNVSVK